MRKILCLAVGFIFMFAATAHAEGEIAVFNLQKVAADSDAMKVAKQSLENKFGAQKNTLEKERKDLEQQAAELQKKKPTEKQQADFMKKSQAYSEKAQAFVRLLQADETRVSTDIDTVITKAAQQLAERKGYGVILDIAAVPYANPKYDITNDMLTEANSVWKSMFKEEPRPVPAARPEESKPEPAKEEVKPAPQKKPGTK